jgi:hypothetical protein
MVKQKKKTKGYAGKKLSAPISGGNTAPKEAVVEAAEVISATPTKATSAELVFKLIELLKKEGATGYICGVVGTDGKILPYIGANSIGDLLTIKYVVEQEVSKVIGKHTDSISDNSALSEQ